MSGIKIHILHCGRIGVAPGLMTSGGDRFAAQAEGLLTPDSKRLWLPVSVYLIEYPRGLVLVDTGWPRAVSPRGLPDRAAQIKLLGLQYHSVCRAVLGPGEAAEEQLAAMGLRPRDIECLLLTHLDSDHAGNLPALRDARRILASEEEYFWSARANLRYRRELWLPSLPFSSTFYYKVKNLGPENRYLDLFGDESIQLVSLSGHSFGNFAVLVQNDGRYVLLTSDAAMSSANWRDLSVPGMAENAVRQRIGIEWIREMADAPGCVAVLASHDPDVRPGVIEL